jgi:hypothetical protein
VVTFSSNLAGFVVGDTNRVNDVFRRSMVTGTTVRVSEAPDGSQLATASSGGSMSASGAWVLFTNQSAVVPADTNNTADVYRRGPLS